MLPQKIRVTVAIFATLIFGIFIFGLSHSISTGFAGFWGGLPFALIALFVFGMAIYDMWDETIRNKNT
tara:strand:- start:79 stop:282 length:204 start_codon:yes stop_codon:yes gene_type:complete